MRIYGQRLKWIFFWATVVATLHADKPFIDFNLKPITSYIRIACTRIRHVNQQSWTANFMQLKSWNHFAPSGSQCPAMRRLTSCAWPTTRGSTTVETTASLTHRPFLASTIRWFHNATLFSLQCQCQLVSFSLQPEHLIAHPGPAVHSQFSPFGK